MNNAGLRAALHRLAHTMRQQGMVLAQKAADNQQTIAAIDIGNRHAQPRCTRLLAVRAEVRLAQTEIHIAAAQTAHQFLQQIELFQRAVRRRQCSDLLCPALVGNLAQTVCHIFQRNRPLDFQPLAVLLEHRFGQALR